MSKRNYLGYISLPLRAVIVLFLIMFIVLFAQFVITQLIWLYTYEMPSPTQISDDIESRINRAEKLYLPDGTMHLVHRMNEKGTCDYTKEEITDADGNVFWRGNRDERPFKYLEWSEPLNRGHEFFDEEHMRRMLLLSLPDLSGVCQVYLRAGEEIKEVWQYDFETDSFTGYKVRGDLIGYLGAGGFVSSKARVKPFGEFHGFTAWTGKDPSAVMMMWQTKRRIYQIDFRSRKVETIFNSPESDVVLVQWHQWRPMNHKDRDASDIRYRPSIDCITADYCHHLVMREPNQIITIKLPEQMWLIRTIRYKMSKVNFVATADNIFLKYYEKGYNPPQPLKLLSQYRYEYNSKPRPQSLQLYKVTDNGSLELVSRFDWIRPAMKIMSVPDRRAVTLNWASVVSPPVFNLLWYIFGDELYEFGAEQIGIIQLYAQIITELRPRYGLLNYILSGAMMAFAFWHGRSRRTSWARLILWLIIVGAFNLAGLLTYLGLNHTPVIGCPVCGEKRGLERPDCVRCGSGLPAPQRKPTDLIMSGASI